MYVFVCVCVCVFCQWVRDYIDVLLVSAPPVCLWIQVMITYVISVWKVIQERSVTG